MGNIKTEALKGQNKSRALSGLARDLCSLPSALRWAIELRSFRAKKLNHSVSS